MKVLVFTRQVQLLLHLLHGSLQLVKVEGGFGFVGLSEVETAKLFSVFEVFKSASMKFK